MYSLVLAVAIILAGLALGRSVLDWLDDSSRGADETIALSAGLGLGLLSFLMLSIGLLGWLYRGAILGLLVTALFIGYRGLWATLSDVGRGLRKLTRWRPRPWQAALAGLLVAFLLLDLLGALAPPTEADAMVYHLAVPAVYVRHHDVIQVPYNTYSYLPFGVQMLYTAGLVLDGSGIVAALIHYGYGILTLLVIYGLGRRYFSASVGLWGTVFFLAVPQVTWSMSIPVVDLGATLYFTLAVLALLRVVEAQRVAKEFRGWRWLGLGGVFAGLTMGTKLQPVVLVAALWIVFLIACLFLIRDRNPMRRVWPALMLGVIAATVASPWFIKNWLHTGNPVYPQLYSIFGGKNWSSALAELQKQHITSKAVGYDLATFVVTPWRMLSQPGNVNIGYFVFAFVPFAYGWSRRRYLLWSVLTLVAVFYVFWFFLVYQRQRHFIYLLPLLSVLAGAGLVWLLNGSPLQRWARSSLKVLTLMSLIAFLGVTLTYQRKAIPVALGLQSRQAYLDRYGYIQEPYRWANANLPPDSRVLVYNLWDMTYYLDVDYMLGNPLVQGVIDYANMQDWRDLAGRVAELDITHVFLVNSAAESADQPGAAIDSKSELPSSLYMRGLILYRGLVENCGQEIARFDYQMTYDRTLGRQQKPFVIRLYLLDWHRSGCDVLRNMK